MAGLVFGMSQTICQALSIADRPGFAALKPILLDSGVYADVCDSHERTCKAQDTRLNLLFTVASSVTNVSPDLVARQC
jgi:hypothetical protein